jgi:hypothetical protein
MNFSEAAKTGRALRLCRFDEETKKLVPKTGWLELQSNGFLVDRETGSEFYPEAHDYTSDNWRCEEETIKVTARKLVEVFKSYIYGLNKKELLTIADGVSHHDLAEDFVRKLDFKELPETFAAVGANDYDF